MTRDYNAQLIGTSRQMQELREEIALVASTEAKVLITGESGVGKELVARAIHAQSRRASGAFVAVNCAGLPETLLESELFGHVRGSFTGAYRDKTGKLELAHRGTMLLDEVGEMTLRMQGLLLRFLETGELQKVGSDRTNALVNVRVIAATNRDLSSLIAEGKFREDLFYRLNVIHLQVPALRDRKEDIPALLTHFLARVGGRSTTELATASAGNGSANVRFMGASGTNGVARGISPEALDVLTEYPWPGNVRELENAIERIVVRTKTEMVGLDDLPSEIRMRQRPALRPKRERRHTVADDLYKRLRQNQESFWTAVYPLYMQREITKQNIRDLVRKGLEEARGNYKIVARLFNMEPDDYKRFLNFLRKHDCQLPFQEYRH